MVYRLLNKNDGKLKEGKVLPSKTNAYLKEISNLCDIKINLTHYKPERHLPPLCCI